MPQLEYDLKGLRKKTWLLPGGFVFLVAGVVLIALSLCTCCSRCQCSVLVLGLSVVHVGTQCLGEGWSWPAKSHPLGTGGMSTQLSHPKQQVVSWG